jgi:hypothetical protein
MMEIVSSIPVAISILFVLTLVLTLFLFYRVLLNSTLNKKQADRVLLGLSIWIAIQMALSFNLFYSTSPELNPPRFPLLVGPPLLLILFLFINKSSKIFIESLSLKRLTAISIVRIPVEIVLYLLASYQAIPEIMTFEGANFDILAGISAVFLLAFAFRNTKVSRRVLLGWNMLSLLLLINIIVIAVLSAPFSFQQISFSQPNWGVLFFPYALLPGFIVPAVLFSHFASLRKLLGKSA